VTDILNFNVLGPLEVLADGEHLPVGGPKKRAILGHLLVHANEVVATSQMVRTLWPGDTPATARKMLQNAVSSIRGMLSANDHGGTTTLLTHSPGYLLRTTAENIDLLRFEQLAKTGRTALAEGEWSAASRSLQESLALWRGPALAVLSDTGITWPKLAALHETRLTILEDYFEAELALGHHREHVAALERLVADEPHREAACQLLMLAMYRCGRQVDALAVYQRTRTALLDGLGLEPTRKLRDLERAILEHASSLQPPTAARVEIESASIEAPRPVTPEPERKIVTFLTVALDVASDDVEEIDDLLHEAGSQIRDELESAGAAVLCSTGSIVQAAFGVPRTTEHDTSTALRTAVALRDRFADGRVRLRLALKIDEVLVTFRGGAVAIAGTAAEQSLHLVRTLPPDEVFVCDAARRSSGTDFVFTSRDRSGIGAPLMWRAKPVRCRHALHDAPTPFVDRDHDLAILGEHFDQVVRRRRCRSVTVLGEAGIGKTRLMSELVARLPRTPEPPVVLRAAIPRHGAGLSGLLADLLDVAPSADESTLRTRIAALTRDSARAASMARQLLSECDAAAELFASIAARGPTVVIVEDLDAADAPTRAFVESMTARAAGLPLLVISTARPEGFDGDRLIPRASTVMTLDRLSDSAVSQLWGAVGGARPTPELLERVDGNPMFAIEFARQGREVAQPSIPVRVYRVFAAMLDRLPAEEKRVVQEAARLGGRISGAGAELRAGLLVRDGGGWVLAHPLLRDVALAQVPRGLPVVRRLRDSA